MPGGSGAIFQLAARGKEDLNLYSLKDPTPFKAVYKKYSHFSLQDHLIPFNTNINFGQICKVTIPNLGDLVGNNLFINIKFPKVSISYKNSIDKEILNLRNNDGTRVETINNLEEFKKYLLNIVDMNNIFANHTDISKLKSVFGTYNTYNNFLVFNINDNTISIDFTDKLYYSSSYGYLEYLFFKKQKLLINKTFKNSHTIQQTIINQLKDSILFIDNQNNLEIKQNINSELGIYHEYYYKISQSLPFEENIYATRYYTVTIAGEISSTITYNIFGLISTSDNIIGDIIDINSNDLKLKLPNILYDLSIYTLIFISNNSCTYTSSYTLQTNDVIKNGSLELLILSVNSQTITFKLNKIPSNDIVITNLFKTSANVDVTLSGFNYRFFTIADRIPNNPNIQNDIVLFFQNLSTTDFKDLFITMMENSLAIPCWFYFQFYSKIFSNTNNTASTNNMISRIINMDRTTYDLDTSKSTLIQDENKYSEFSKNFNTLYLNTTSNTNTNTTNNTNNTNNNNTSNGYGSNTSTNTNTNTVNDLSTANTKILTNISTSFTNMITTKLNSYKNQIVDDYTTTLANYLLTGTANSLKDLFKVISQYSSKSAAAERVVYNIDISPTGGLFNAAADAIIHSNFGNINLTAAQVGSIAIIEAGGDANTIIMRFRIESILTTIHNKKYDTDVLTQAEFDTFKILDNATHYSFDNNGTYMKLKISSRTKFLDTVLYTSDTLINDEALYVASNVYYFTNFLLCDYIYYIRNTFKNNFFSQVTYLFETTLENRIFELFAKIRNKYMIQYLAMEEISTTGRLYLSEIIDYYDLYDAQNIINHLINRDALTELEIKSILDNQTVSSVLYKYSHGTTINDIHKVSNTFTFPYMYIIYGNLMSILSKSDVEAVGLYVIDLNPNRIYCYSKTLITNNTISILDLDHNISLVSSLLYKGINYKVNEKLNIGTNSDYYVYNISKVNTNIFIKKDLSTNITEFKFKIGDTFFAKCGLTYVSKISLSPTEKTTIYKVTDSITFMDNGYNIDSLNDINDIVNDSTILSGYITDSSDSVTIDYMMIDTIDTLTLNNMDLDVTDNNYYTGGPGDNLNTKTKAEVFNILINYLKEIKEAYPFYYILKNYEKRNTSYFNFIRGFTENLENIGFTIDSINRYIEEKIGFKLKTYETEFSNNLERKSFQNDNNLITNSIDLYKLIQNQFTSYKTNYSQSNTIFNIQSLILNDKYYYSSYNLLSNLDSILYSGDNLVSKYYSPNNLLLKNIYRPLFADQRIFIEQQINFLKNILLKKSIYDYVFLFSIYGFIPNIKLEEIIHTITSNQNYSSTNYSASLLSTEETNSVEFNTLFADKAIYKYKNTLMSFDEYTQAKTALDKYSSDGSILAKEVLIREKYNSLPNICIDAIRSKNNTFGNTSYKHLQLKFEEQDTNTQFIKNIPFYESSGYFAFDETDLGSLSQSDPYVKIYANNNVYYKKLTYDSGYYHTDIVYDISFTIDITYGYHILKNIIVDTKELYEIKNSINNSNVSKVNDIFKRNYQLPISLNLIGDENDLLNLSLSRNFNKDSLNILNKAFLMAIRAFKKNNTNEIDSDITYDNSTLSASSIDDDFLMIFGDKISGYGYYDEDTMGLNMIELNKLEDKASYNCNLYKLGLNKYDTGYKNFLNDSIVIPEETTTTLTEISYTNLPITYGYEYPIDFSSITIDSSGIYYMYNFNLDNNTNLTISDSVILTDSISEVPVSKIISVVNNRVNVLTETYIANPLYLRNHSYTKITSNSPIYEPVKGDSIIIDSLNYELMSSDNTNLIIKKNYDVFTTDVNIILKDWYTSDLTVNISNNSIILVDDVLSDVRVTPNGYILINSSTGYATSIKYGIKAFINSSNINNINYDPEPILKLFYNDSVLFSKIGSIDNITLKSNLGLTNTNGQSLILKIRELFFKQIENLNEKKWYNDTHDLDYSINSNLQTIKTPIQEALIIEQFNVLSNYRTYVKNSNSIRNRDSIAQFKFTENYGLNMIKNIKLKLGDFLISEYDSDYIYITNKLLHKNLDGFSKMVGNDATNYSNSDNGNFYIPVPWMFKKIPFPLIASPYTKLSLEVELRNLESLMITDDANTFTITSRKPKLFLLANYYYLEYEQRRLFAEYRHEYLVEQVNKMIVPRPRFDLKVQDLVKIPIEFGHPTKDMYFFFKAKTNIDNKLWNKYSIKSGEINRSRTVIANNFLIKQIYTEDINNNPIKEAKIKINGKDRMKYYEGIYFNEIIPYQYYNNEVDTGINVYSFSINPTNESPSGSINLSYVNDMQLFLKLHTSVSGNIHVYTRNYNILRVMSGQSGIIYLN